MKAVVLAAGRSTRTYPLTVNTPKPLLKVANKTILQHNLEQLEGLVDEVILVVGFKADLIKQEMGNKFGSIQISYVEQEEQLGTGHAIMQAQHLLDDRFMVFGADDLFSRKDIQKCISHRYALLAQEVDDPQRFGICECREGRLVGMEEKPEHPKSNLANTGFYVLETDIFDITLKPSPRGEYEITDYVKELIVQGKEVHCYPIEDYWLPIGYPWDLLKANDLLLPRLKSSMKGDKADDVIIEGKVVVGEGTRLLNGTHLNGNILIGKNCIVGPNASITGNTSIGDGAYVGNETQIHNSTLMENSKVEAERLSHSIIGQGTKVEKGTLTKDSNQGTVKSDVKGKTVDSGMEGLGTIAADDVHIGKDVTLAPGVKIWPGRTIPDGSDVTKDVE